MTYLIPALSFILCLTATPIVRYAAQKKGWVDLPTQERWHKKPTALLGGVALYIGLAGAFSFTADFNTILPHFSRMHNPMVVPPSAGAVLWIGVTFLFILGLLDDFLNVKPQTKLIGQIVIASLTAFLGLRLHWFTSLSCLRLITLDQTM